jgi:phosphatidylinositol kinase/protein kinase (PI-3  family)
VYQLPAIVPLSAHVRLVQTPAHPATSLASLFEVALSERPSETEQDGSPVSRLDSVYLDMLSGKDISAKCAPSMLTEMIQSVMASQIDFWTFRKHFTQQYSLFALLQIAFACPDRRPAHFQIDMTTGTVFLTDWLEALKAPTLVSHLRHGPSQPVPFRMTPNLQHFITPLGLESLFLPSIMAAARVLLGEFSTSSVFELENYLLLFLKDESLAHPSAFPSSTCDPIAFHTLLFQALDLIYQRFLAMAGHEEREKLSTEHLVTLASMPPGTPMPSSTTPLHATTGATDTTQSSLLHVPVHQHLLNLLNAAVNPQNLRAMPPMWLSPF